jgi:hypothetical protein
LKKVLQVEMAAELNKLSGNNMGWRNQVIKTSKKLYY